ncbi:MAG: oligosaccharide flippase family protein, partial [Phormidesmis sp. CAN_BIN44]|nr:oligosaccharide flippase family protein [Phormidesmis sp. CAN_BIN44]
MTLQQKAVKGIAWSFIQSYGNQVITLVVFLLLARLLTPEVFGLIALANIFINFIQIFLDQGLGEAIVQRKELEPEHLDTAFWTNVASGAILMSIGLLSADLVAQFFHEPKLSSVIRWLSLSLIIGSLNVVQRALLRRNLAFKTLAIRTLIASLVAAVVGIIMAFQGLGVWSLVGMTLTERIIGTAILWKV